jgi:uncharacterized membrane protein YgcG
MKMKCPRAFYESQARLFDIGYCMKKLILAIFMCLGLMGCVDEAYTVAPEYANVRTGTFEYCDDYGCRWISAPYYYSGGELFYMDAHFGCWIGPRGYWLSGVWHPGFYPGYHAWYHSGWYHRGGYRGGWRGGYGGFRGGFHGGFHGGGHGGHR